MIIINYLLTYSYGRGNSLYGGGCCNLNVHYRKNKSANWYDLWLPVFCNSNFCFIESQKVSKTGGFEYVSKKIFLDF